MYNGKMIYAKLVIPNMGGGGVQGIYIGELIPELFFGFSFPSGITKLCFRLKEKEEDAIGIQATYELYDIEQSPAICL